MRMFNSILFLFALSFVFSFAVFAQSDNPKVLKYVAPKYPAVAEEFRASGSVIVEVEIDKRGKVISAVAISGNKFLRRMSEKVAEEWVFSSDDYKEKRRIRISFEFHLDNKNKKDRIKFVKPYTLKLFASRTRITTLKTGY